MIATRPAPPPSEHASSEPAERSPIPARPQARLLRLFLLGCAGLLLESAWLMLWPLSYRLTHGNDFTYTYLVTRDAIWERLHDMIVLANQLVPGIEPEPRLETLVNSLVVVFVLAGFAYLAGLFLLDRGVASVAGAGWVVLGISLVSQVTLFLLPGLFTTDIFSYVMYGHISAIYGLNPYIYPPAAFPSNPLLGWIYPIWHDAPSVYGPLWTDLGWVMAWLSQPLSLVDRVFAYKLLMNVVHLANLGLVWWLLGLVKPDGGSPRARITAFAVFAWNPLMLFEVAGNAHNDALMVLLLLLSVVPLALFARSPAPSGATVRRGIPNPAWVAACLCLALSAMVKYMSGLVGFFYALVWARQLPTARSRVLWLGGTAAAATALILALAWPWLQIPAVLDPLLNAASGKLYTNSLPDLAALTVADQLLDPSELTRPQTHEAVRYWMKALTRGLFVLYLAWEARRVWQAALGERSVAIRAILSASVRAFLVLLLLVMTWVLDWYYLWPLALATLLGWRNTLTRITVALTLTLLPIFYAHHYWDWRMPGWLLLVYAGPPLLLPLVERALRSRAERPGPRTSPL